MTGTQRRPTGRIQVPLPPGEAFRLLTPRGEQDWAHGWHPSFPAPAPDDTEPGTVFETSAHGQHTTWLVTDRQPGKHISYARVTPRRPGRHRFRDLPLIPAQRARLFRMSAAIDHVGIPAADPEAAGAFLAWVLGEGRVVPDGPPDDDSGDMFSLVLDGWSLAFVRAPQPVPLHLAIRVAPEAFTAAVARLGGRGIAFGNDPEDPANGRTDDPLGGAGRAYFRDRDGHLYELVAVPAPR